MVHTRRQKQMAGGDGKVFVWGRAQVKKCMQVGAQKAYKKITEDLRTRWKTIRKQTGVDENEQWKENDQWFPRTNTYSGHLGIGNFAVLSPRQLPKTLSTRKLAAPFVGTLMVSDTSTTLKAFQMKEESEARLKVENGLLRAKMRALEKQLKDFKAKEKTAKAMLELSKN